ncbi:vWA domain-containing protein [Helicobacter suis]|uniref:vWA domain-containing protein n=1 Tax=Helicobacter suis TaxID=104628 RepID=UPI0013D0C726|nr:VWA domain-containing protein [Helicobacter suis]
MSDFDDDELSEDTGDDLADNPSKRVPVCLCLDTSSSMDGQPIDELNEGVRLFYEAVNDDMQAKQCAEVCIVTFGDSGVRVVQDFQSIRGVSAPRFSAGGYTPMGGGVTEALNCLERRKQEYKSKGVPYFQPWFVLMTDGQPTDSIDSAAQRSSGMAKNKKLYIMPIVVSGGDANTLSRFSPINPPLKLQGLNFKEFFKWLSASVVKTSHSRPGDSLKPLPTDSWSDMGSSDG